LPLTTLGQETRWAYSTMPPSLFLVVLFQDNLGKLILMRQEMLKYRINSKSQVKSPGLDALWASSYNLQLAWDSKNYENCKTRKNSLLSYR